MFRVIWSEIKIYRQCKDTHLTFKNTNTLELPPIIHMSRVVFGRTLALDAETTKFRRLGANHARIEVEFQF